METFFPQWRCCTVPIIRVTVPKSTGEKSKHSKHDMQAPAACDVLVAEVKGCMCSSHFVW